MQDQTNTLTQNSPSDAAWNEVEKELLDERTPRERISITQMKKMRRLQRTNKKWVEWKREGDMVYYRHPTKKPTLARVLVVSRPVNVEKPVEND